MRNRFRKALLTVCVILTCSIAVYAVWYFSGFILDGGSPGADLSRFASREGRLPVTLTIFGRSSDTISARLAFYDADGNLAGAIERSWPGWELRLDCVMVGSSSGWFVFPFSVSTDESHGGRGLNLLRYYNDAGMPALYDSVVVGEKERVALKKLFSIVRSERWVPFFLGSLHHESVTIRSFVPNAEYALFVSKTGRLSLKNE